MTHLSAAISIYILLHMGLSYLIDRKKVSKVKEATYNRKWLPGYPGKIEDVQLPIDSWK